MSAKVLIERMELVRHIVDEAQRLAPDRITFHWSQSCHVSSLSQPSSEDLCMVGSIRAFLTLRDYLILCSDEESRLEYAMLSPSSLTLLSFAHSISMRFLQ